MSQATTPKSAEPVEMQEQNNNNQDNNTTEAVGNEPVEAPKKSEETTKVAKNPAASTASTGGSNFSLAVSWDNLKYTVVDGKDDQGNEKRKEILKGLTGQALPGRTLAIMGSSGAGKTTFLNALSDRLQNDAQHIVGGKMLLNDVPYNTKYRKLLGYVTQDDIMNQMSTPVDLFTFSLRIRRGADHETTALRVEEMLEELKLTNSKDTLVGNPPIISGLSGGERKRANIGVELIADPKVLFLDEPTSGLDAVTSLDVIKNCADLASRGRTVIYTIHQPTAEVVQQFQDLMLMCQGHCVYHGTMEKAVDYFAAIGYMCPDNYTPTDYFMILLQNKEIGTKLIEHWQEYLSGGKASAHNTAGTPTPGNNDGARVEHDGNAVPTPDTSETKQYLDRYIANHGSSIGVQFSELFKRSFSNIGRNKMYIGMSIVQSAFFALVAGILFVNLKDDVQGIQDRMGLIFMVAANRCFSGAMMMVNTFPPEKQVFIREQQGGAYSPAIYFLAKSFSELPIQLIGVIIESTILYFMTGLVVDAGRFFHYIAIVFMLFQGATGLGMLISCAVDSFTVASGLAPLIIVPMMLAGGLLGSVDRLRPGWIWLEKISIIRYGFMLLANNEFNGLDEITCDPAKFSSVNGTAFCSRQPKSGKEVLQLYEFSADETDHSYWLMWVCLACWIVLARVGCVVALNRVAKHKN